MRKQEHTTNIQIGHRHVLLSSPTHQITAIRANYMGKNVPNELYCKTADSPQQKCAFPPMLFFPVMRMETFALWKWNGKIFRPLDHEDEVQFARGFTVTTFAR